MIDADKHEGSEAEKEVAIFAALCNVQADMIESLDIADYHKLQEAYKDFLS